MDSPREEDRHRWRRAAAARAIGRRPARGVGSGEAPRPPGSVRGLPHRLREHASHRAPGRARLRLALGKKEHRPPPAAPPGPFNAAFAGLAGRVGLPAPAGGSPPDVAAPPPAKPGPARAVVRMERAGRGGQIVTVVEKLALPPRELERWLGDLKRSLGCGGVVEGDALVLQGDNRDRVGALLEARGVRKVTVA